MFKTNLIRIEAKDACTTNVVWTALYYNKLIAKLQMYVADNESTVWRVKCTNGFIGKLMKELNDSKTTVKIEFVE